MVRTGAETMK